MLESTIAPADVRHRGAGRLRGAFWSQGRPVLVIAAAMVLAQLGFRAWAIFGSWFQFDNFAFISLVSNQPLGRHLLLTQYAGHLMPAGFLLTWLNVQVAPLGFTLPAAELLFFQALADVGAVVFLISAFGRRRGILAPLALFLFAVISLPAYIWWAAGVGQIPFLAAVFWASWTHLNYLRTGRLRHAVATMAITLASLAFYEKTLLVFAVFAFLPLAYFASGNLGVRIRSVVSRYRAGTVLYVAVAAGYLALYLRFGLNFDPQPSARQPLGDVAANMAGSAYATSVLGGPFRWQMQDLGAIAAPGRGIRLAAIALLLLFAYEVARTRTRSKRAWILLGVFLASDVALVAAGRAALIGAQIALEFRYITELAAVSAIVLGLATMPLLGAPEQVEPRRPSVLLDARARVASVVVVCAALAIYSSASYVNHWQGQDRSRTYFDHARHDLGSADQRVPLVDVAVPQFLLWGYDYPANTASHILKMMSAHTTYPKIRTDDIYTLDDDGRVRPVVIQPVRHAAPSDDKSCPYPAQGGSVTVPLDGPVIGRAWWVRATYYAQTAGTLHVTAGEESYDVFREPGLHSLFFEAGGRRFDALSFDGLSDASRFCVSDVDLGTPIAFRRAS